jgi:hypothetical protein
MPTILKDCLVRLSSIRWPQIWPSRETFSGLTVDHDGQRKPFLTFDRLLVFTKEAAPAALSGEIAPSSVIDPQTNGDTLLGIQQMKPKNDNPFSGAAL